MPPAADFDALSEGSDLTASGSSQHSSGDEGAMPSGPRTPAKKRRRTTARLLVEDDDEDEDEVADALEGDELDELDEDELEEDDDEDDYDAPSTSRRSSGRKAAPRAAASTPKRGSGRTSTRTTTAAVTTSTPSTSAKKSLRVKLTRTPAKEEASPAQSKAGRPSRAAAAAATPPTSRRAKDSSKVKWKPRAVKGGKDSDEDDEDEIATPEDDDELLEDEEENVSISRAPTLDDSDEGSASEPDEATQAEMAAIMGKTARQLAREGGVEQDHMELPMFDPNRKKKLTENEIALRRSETARKRKNQVEKKLEDDKVETINRLLKKQVARSRNKLVKKDGDEGDSGDDEEAAEARKRGREELSRKAPKEMPAPYFRYVDRAEGKVLAIPTGAPLIEEVFGPNYVEVNSALIQELDTPIKTEGLGEKAKELQTKSRKRLAQQGEQWKEDQQLEQVWGQEGLYEYKLRTALGQSRKAWIGSRRPPTPEVEEQEAAEQEEAQDEGGEEAEGRADEGDQEMADEESK